MSAEHWESLAEGEERMIAHYAALGNPHGSTDSYAHRAKTYRDAAKALRLQESTGKPHCVCCLKPMGHEKPYWKR